VGRRKAAARPQTRLMCRAAQAANSSGSRSLSARNTVIVSSGDMAASYTTLQHNCEGQHCAVPNPKGLGDP